MRFIWVVLLLVFPSYAKDYLYPLGKNGIYYYDSTREYINNIEPKGLDSLAIFLVYPPSKPPRMVRINQTFNHSVFSITVAADISQPNHAKTINISQYLAEKLSNAFDRVTATVKVPDQPLLAVDGTDYVFYRFPYGGHTWGEAPHSQDDISVLIRALLILIEQTESNQPLSINQAFLNELAPFDKHIQSLP